MGAIPRPYGRVTAIYRMVRKNVTSFKNLLGLFQPLRGTRAIQLLFQMRYENTAFGVINNPSILMPVEFLQTVSDLVVLFLLSSPASIACVKSDSK